jgi:probable F420-dependent oxidoreductase
MQWGFNAPVSGPLSGVKDFTLIVSEGEAIGYDYCTLSDHVIIPRELENKYPYSDTGEFPGRAGGDRHEQLTAVTFAAAKTSKLRLVTSVMVVPHRPAVLTAKVLATIDVLSGGRLSVGCGAGWMAEEFEALGTPPFAARGAVTDEYLQAFRALWTEDNPRFDGTYVKFANINFAPKPVQKPHPPLWIGGESPPALRRAAKLGDGWYPIPANPQFPLDTFPRYRTALSRLRQLAAEAGREPASLLLGYRSQRHGAIDQPRTPDGERKIFAGSAADIVGDIKALAELGVSQVDFRLGGASLDETLTNMRRFRDDVIARV